MSGGCSEGTFTCRGECVSREVYQANCGGAAAGQGGSGSTDDGGSAGEAGAPSSENVNRVPCELVYRFTLDLEEPAESVHLSGSMNAWSEPGIELTGNADGSYSVDVELQPGEYLYRFVVDGDLSISDPRNPNGIDVDGNRTSVISVHAGNAQSFSGDCDSECLDTSEFEWRDGIMYSVFTDRFLDSDSVGSEPSADGSAENPRFGWGGGDIAGVRSKLDYIADLGVSLIWLGPPQLQAPYGYHGYWPLREDSDYGEPLAPTPAPEIEPRFGSAEELKQLIDEAHGRGIKVLLDYVAKHVHASSPLAVNHPDWFFLQNGQPKPCSDGSSSGLWDDPYWGTRCTFSDFLWPFDYQASSQAIDWTMLDVRYWVTTYGFDALRIDAAKHVAPVWIERLREELDGMRVDGGLKPYLLGETYSYDPDVVAKTIDPARSLDGQFDFPMRRHLCAALLTRDETLAELAYEMAVNSTRYPDGSLMATFLGNHDIPRQIHYATGEIGDCSTGSSDANNAPFTYAQPDDVIAYRRLELAFVALLTNPGVPTIYAGDEIGLAGGGDPENRRMMPWSDASLSAPQKWLRSGVRAMANLRRENRALSRGPRQTFSADADTWVYERLGCGTDSGFVVAINRGLSEVTLDLPAGAYTEIAGGRALEWEGGSTITLEPLSYVVLRR